MILTEPRKHVCTPEAQQASSSYLLAKNMAATHVHAIGTRHLHMQSQKYLTLFSLK